MSRNIVILTGAGISAESGLKTFRDAGGLWEGHRPEDVATPEAFQRDPDLVYRFYNARRQQLLSPEVQANEAHKALARLEDELDGQLTLVTQNIDDLHERGGSKNVLHMHGELLKARCTGCGTVTTWTEDFDDQTPCPHCQQAGYLRPDIVWFGEMPFFMDQIFNLLSDCDIFAAIGTSGQVYPAAGFVEVAHTAGAQTFEINLEPSDRGSEFQERLYGPATQMVPQWVESLL